MRGDENVWITPVAYAGFKRDDRVRLLFQYLVDLNRRLSWVDDELDSYGICAICVTKRLSGDDAADDHICAGGI